MRIRFKAALTAGITMVALLGAYPIQAAQALTPAEQDFSGYTTGTQVSADLLELDDQPALDAQVTSASASVDSTGLSPAIDNEMGHEVSPDLVDKNSHGQGHALEVDILGDPPEVALAGVAVANAPPPEGVPVPITQTLGPLDIGGLVSAGLLTGKAQAIYDPSTCTIGQPLSYGNGEAADVEILPTPLGGSLLSLAAAGSGETTAQTRSFEYFIPNGDGTFGLVSETRQVIAPIAVGTVGVAPAPITIRVDGEFVMRLTATGKPGLPPLRVTTDVNDPEMASIEFSDPLISILDALGNPIILPLLPNPFTLSALLGSAGVNLALPLGLGNLSLGGPPRAIDGGPPAPVAPDGTSVSAAYDLLGLQLSVLGLLDIADVRVGHMEGDVNVPPGGIECNIPVSKTATPDPVQAGQDVTVTISIPDDPARFATLFSCDLINISAVDHHEVLEGNPQFEIVSASNGGVIEGDDVFWPNLGNYVRGSPPIVLTVILHVFGGTGVLQDIADVSASLGNCDGGVAGQDIAGQGAFQNAAVSGDVVHIGPNVGRGGVLPSTGGTMMPLVLGGSLLLIALGVRRFARRGGSQSTPSS